MERDKGPGRLERHSQGRPNQPERSPHGGVIKSPERQPLPTVRDVVERHQRFYTDVLKHRLPSTEGNKESLSNTELERELVEKGKLPRDGLIYRLIRYARFNDLEDRIWSPRYVTKMEYQLFCSALRLFSDKQIEAELKWQISAFNDRYELWKWRDLPHNNTSNNE
jgi:hypothetical protein